MPDAKNVRILVVDDDPAIGRLLEKILVGVGFEPPRCVRTGREALALADEADIVLLDHRLPDVKGMDLVPTLRARPGRPAVVLVTAHGNESLAARALRLGADDYLIKDNSLAELVPQVIERVRRNRALRETLAAAERDLVHAERRAAIGQLSVSLHHAINNPLMTASAEVDMLLAREPRLPDDERDSLVTVKQSLLRIGEILDRARNLRHDATEEYLAGIPMIDLSRRTLPVAVMRGDALLYVADEDLARVLSILLRHAGFGVERVATLEALAKESQRKNVVLVLMNVGAGAESDALGGFRPPTRRDYTLVALVQGETQSARAAGADHVIMLPFDPGTFTNDLLEVMKR